MDDVNPECSAGKNHLKFIRYPQISYSNFIIYKGLLIFVIGTVMILILDVAMAEFFTTSITGV